MSEKGDERGERKRITQQVTLVGALVNALLAVVKIVVGLVAQSQSLVADGIHSVSDLLSDVLVYVAAHHAGQAPDLDHPYGHGRFETAATLGLGILLVLIAAGISWDAIERLFTPDQLLHPGPMALYAAAFSIVANEALYHYTIHAARKIKSSMLQANAWHHRSDAVSSIVVLVGVAGTMAGLPYLDAIAAVAVGLMVAKIGWDLGWPAFQELMDEGLDEARLKHIRETILSVGGVDSIHMLRTRKMGGEASADVHVLVAPWISVSEGHMISQLVTDQLLMKVEELTDVTVHIDPEDDETAIPCQGLPLRPEAEMMLGRQWREVPGASARERLVLHYLAGKIDVDIYFPLEVLPEGEKLGQFHSALRQAVETLPEFGRVEVYYG
ncbi:MAG: cation diffusion facilitator family transporter [Candidatus Sedimenticola sp. (ex Thyasira tokunagai)]